MTYTQLHKVLAQRIRKFGLRETARDCKIPHSTLQTLMQEDGTRWRTSHVQQLAKGLGLRIEYVVVDTVTGARIEDRTPVSPALAHVVASNAAVAKESAARRKRGAQ